MQSINVKKIFQNRQKKGRDALVKVRKRFTIFRKEKRKKGREEH